MSPRKSFDQGKRWGRKGRCFPFLNLPLTWNELSFMRYFMIGLLSMLAGTLFARTWTDIDGRETEAEFVGLNGEMVTIRLDRDGKTYEVPLTRFSTADRVYIAERMRQEAASSGAKESSRASPTVPGHLEKVRRHLVDAKGKRWSGGDPADCRYTLFYFSAHWCPPCQIFSPKLVSFYNGKKVGSNFEIIFVSSDYSADAMEDYMQELAMPWPAVKFSRIKDAGLSAYAGPGIPCLVLFDEAGNVLSHSYVNGSYVGPTRVLKDLEKLL